MPEPFSPCILTIAYPFVTFQVSSQGMPELACPKKGELLDQ